jgi:uncharacterized membrane protein YdjX (TVP38/TMEM64 family)
MSRTRVLAVLVLAAVVAVSAYSLPLAEWTTQLAVGMLPGTAMWVYLGSLAPAAAELSSAASGGGTTRTILYIAGLAATVAAAVIGARAAKRALDAQLQEPTSL